MRHFPVSPPPVKPAVKPSGCLPALDVSKSNTLVFSGSAGAADCARLCAALVLGPLLAALFERHHKRIYHYCQRMTGNQTTSQDLVQDVFMRILKYRKTFRGDSRFLPWLYRMAHNACIDHFRKSSRDPLLPDELPEVTSSEPSASSRRPTEQSRPVWHQQHELPLLRDRPGPRGDAPGRVSSPSVE